MTVPNQRKEVVNNQYIKKIKIKYTKRDTVANL